MLKTDAKKLETRDFISVGNPRNDYRDDRLRDHRRTDWKEAYEKTL